MAKLTRRPEEDKFLGKIWDILIAPLIAHTPQTSDNKRHLEDVFCVDTRHINSYKVKQDFVMPGLKVEAPRVRIQGIGYRYVSAGKILTVRIDDTLVDQVDVEYYAGQGAAHQWYQLTNSEWEFIKLYLDPYVILERHFSEKED